MVNCRTCQEKFDLTCKECVSLIDGVVLQKKLENPMPVSVESAEGRVYPGSLFVVSPVGLGIQASLDSSDYYIIRAESGLEIKVSKIRGRGKSDCHGFDIVKVIRADGSSGRLNSAEYGYLMLTVQ